MIFFYLTLYLEKINFPKTSKATTTLSNSPKYPFKTSYCSATCTISSSIVELPEFLNLKELDWTIVKTNFYDYFYFLNFLQKIILFKFVLFKWSTFFWEKEYVWDH